MEPQVTVLKQEIVPANETIASYLKIPKGTAVLRLEKRYRANRLTLNLSESYLTLADFPGIEHQDFSTTTLEVLRVNIMPIQKRPNTPSRRCCLHPRWRKSWC